MKNLFEKISKFDSNNPKLDLLSYAQKAISYIIYISEMAKITELKYVKNSIRIIEAFPNDYTAINKEVEKIEAMAAELTRSKNKKDSKLPGSELFRNGTIVIGRVDGTDIEVKLTVEQFSGNMVIYGQYGMGKTNLNQLIISQLVS